MFATSFKQIIGTSEVPAAFIGIVKSDNWHLVIDWLRLTLALENLEQEKWASGKKDR